MSLASRFVRPLFAVSLIALFSLPAGASPHPPRKAPCVVEDIDTPTMPACVVQSRNGALFVPKKYWMHPAFNRYGLSAFSIDSFGAVYINRSGRLYR